MIDFEAFMSGETTVLMIALETSCISYTSNLGESLIAAVKPS